MFIYVYIHNYVLHTSHIQLAERTLQQMKKAKKRPVEIKPSGRAAVKHPVYTHTTLPPAVEEEEGDEVVEEKEADIFDTMLADYPIR